AVPLHVDTRHGDLGAVAGLAGDRLDLDGAVLDLWDLALEQPPNEVRVRPRQDDLDPVALLLDVEDDGLDPLVDVVRLAGDLLATGQERLRPAEANERHAAVEALDGAGDEFALLLLVLVEDGRALLLADALDEQLLGGLGGDASEVVGVELLALADGGDGAVVAVDLDLDVLLLPELLEDGQLDALLDEGEN